MGNNMADLEMLERSLKERGFGYAYFTTREEAAEYLDGKIDGTTVGMGGSVTMQELGLYDKLCRHNTVFWHHRGGSVADANKAEVYLSSLNGLAETGECINIDGTGNRVSAGTYGPKRVYYVVGLNKVAPDFESALWRARNIASPKNALRLGVKTPCVKHGGDKCYDCKSPERICRALLVLWEKPRSQEETEIVVVGEELGF